MNHRSAVSTRLAAQALEALEELLRGFAAANETAQGRLLDRLAREDPDHVFRGLLAVLLRLVFLAHAEDRGSLPPGRAPARHESVAGLFEQLREDARRSPDEIDRRFGAWPRLCALFRAVSEGARPGGTRAFPAPGNLFDPERWPFLEGRSREGARESPNREQLPSVPDAAVCRVLDKLLMLDGERLPYGSLDIERIGSVYENLMGYTLEAVSPGAPGAIRGAGLRLLPTGERRRSGSHYTSRGLTEPIVRATLRPLLERLGDAPAPGQILSLKICDPAMGSGAFLVEACRQLAAELVRSWDAHGAPDGLARADDPLPLARRLVAQRCLYGVDENPVAVDLAKLSLWLATLGRGHPFAFLDHGLRCGDSLVGLTREQIASFHWQAGPQLCTVRRFVEPALRRAQELRSRIRSAALCCDDAAKHALLREADDALGDVRLVGDCVVACYVGAGKDRERERALGLWQPRVESWLAGGAGRRAVADFVAETLRDGTRPIRCLHWEVEMPEVFAATARDGTPAPGARARGFDAVIGNPPWVSYAGRAAQPLAIARRRFYLGFYEAFAGYRNVQALFVERAARAVAPGGRLGLVLPSSMAELEGYGPSRAAHDRHAECDPDLPDLGEDSFRGVFQPSMVLRSTVRPEPLAHAGDGPWPLERPDLDDDARALIAKLDGPLLPPELFGERGLQTLGADTEHLRAAPDESHSVPLRAGGDIQAFCRGAPSLYAAPAWFGDRLRPPAEWQQVRVLIRQTARVPIAALSDGIGFRNSILAGFECGAYSAAFLVAYLNSTPIRWSHYFRNRDARLGMPQVKIGHLRSIPAPREAGAVAAIERLGVALCARNDGTREREHRELDEAVARAFALTASELARMRRDAAAWT
jgi:hypothetical protein